MNRIPTKATIFVLSVTLLLVSIVAAQNVEEGAAKEIQPVTHFEITGQTAVTSLREAEKENALDSCTIGTWQTVAPVNTARSRPGLAYLAATGKFYLAGGEATGSDRDNPIEEYDPVANTWSDRTNLLTGVSNTGAAGVGNYVYVPGGYNGTGGIDDMQRFDPVANIVTTMASLPAANYAHAVTTLNGKIYVLGGSLAGTAGTTNYIYDIRSDTWSTGAALPTAVNYPAAASDGTYVYVFGGTTSDLATVQRYNPRTDSWDTMADMSAGRGGLGAFFDGANLWVVGGGWVSYLTSTEYWDGVSWQAGPIMSVGARTLGAAFGDGLALKAAGWASDFLDAAETLRIYCPASIVVDPGELTQTQNPGQILTTILAINNTGLASLNWEIFEEAPTALLSKPAGNYVPGLYAPSVGLAPADGKSTATSEAPLVETQLGTTGYAVEAANGYFTAFNLDVPEILPNLAPYTNISFPGAGEVVGDYAYVIDGTTMTQIDLDTGSAVVTTTVTMPPGSHAYTGMAQDPTSGNVYVSSCDIATSILYTIDMGSGTISQIGTITNSPCTIAIAIDGNGELWGYDIVNDSFLSINKTTAAGTIIGSLGFDANFGQGMDWDAATDQVYLTAFNNSTFQGELRLADRVTGNTNLIGLLGSGTPGGLSQLPWLGMFACMPNDISWLSINPTSGTVTAGGAQDVTVSFDSTGLLPGTYNGTLCIGSNDAINPQVRVPVTLTVELNFIYLPIVLKP